MFRGQHLYARDIKPQKTTREVFKEGHAQAARPSLLTIHLLHSHRNRRTDAACSGDRHCVVAGRWWGTAATTTTARIGNPSVVTASAISSTATSRLRRRARGTPASTTPNAISSPDHGSRGVWFAAELDAVIVKLIVLLPLADSVAVPLDGLTVITGELVVAVHVVVSANVVDANVTVSDCGPPSLSGTVVGDGVIV